MKRSGTLAHRTLGEDSEDDITPADPYHVSIKRFAGVLLVGAILACAHREISGKSDGSLLSAFTSYAGGALHHLVSILLNSHL